MRISDWSSDVCSSDLLDRGLPAAGGDDIEAFAQKNQAQRFGLCGAVFYDQDLWHRSGSTPCWVPQLRQFRRNVLQGQREVGGSVIDGRFGHSEDDGACLVLGNHHAARSEEHTSELQQLMRIPYAGFCLKQTTT